MSKVTKFIVSIGLAAMVLLLGILLIDFAKGGGKPSIFGLFAESSVEPPKKRVVEEIATGESVDKECRKTSTSESAVLETGNAGKAIEKNASKTTNCKTVEKSIGEAGKMKEPEPPKANSMPVVEDVVPVEEIIPKKKSRSVDAKKVEENITALSREKNGAGPGEDKKKSKLPDYERLKRIQRIYMTTGKELD